MPIRVMIVDDHRLMREGLETLLGFENEISVISMAENGVDALEQISKEQPDIVLIDIRMPVMNGVQCTEQIRKNYPKVKVLILTTFDDDEYIIDCLKCGAQGYLLKDLSSEKLVSSIRDVYEGNAVLSPEITAKIMMHISDQNIKKEHKSGSVKENELTEREKEILKKMAKGLNNREIANSLFITEGTVKNYITNIYSKLGINDRTKAILYAMDNKYI